jgi:hypothetical protein
VACPAHDAEQISAKLKGAAVPYNIIAASNDEQLLSARFTADTVYEALAKVQSIRSRGFLVEITGPDGNAISANELEAEAASIRLLRLRRGDFGRLSASGTQPRWFPHIRRM